MLISDNITVTNSNVFSIHEPACFYLALILYAFRYKKRLKNHRRHYRATSDIHTVDYTDVAGGRHCISIPE